MLGVKPRFYTLVLQKDKVTQCLCDWGGLELYPYANPLLNVTDSYFGIYL